MPQPYTPITELHYNMQDDKLQQNVYNICCLEKELSNYSESPHITFSLIINVIFTHEA